MNVVGRQSQEGTDPNLQIDLNTLKSYIQEIVHGMPEQRQRIYRLSRESGMSREEIAEYLGISPNTVRVSVVSALKTIREELRKKGYYLPLFYLLLIKA